MLKFMSTFTKSIVLLAGFGLVASEAFCGGTLTGAIVTDLQKNKEHVVVYLKGAVGPVTTRKATVEQHHLMFIPKVTTVPVGSTVVFTNHDKIYHNVFSRSEAKSFNLNTYDPGKPKHVVFDKPGAVNLLCNVHPEMSAWVVVTDNKYSAITGKDGLFTINDIPAGTYQIGVWSEKSRQLEETTVTVIDGKTSNVDIKLGD